MSSGTGSWRSWLPVTVWLLVIFGVSSIPNLQVPDVGVPIADKFSHLGEYAVLGALFARARMHGARVRRAAWGGALLGLVVGTVDELYQRGTPGRQSSALDAAADVLGATLGAVVWTWSMARWQARPRRNGES
jgi:VanZ family protein